MNRRLFITRLSQAATTVCAAVYLPIEILPAAVRRESAIAIMTKAFNAHTKGRSCRLPLESYASAAFMHDLESELPTITRFTDKVEVPITGPLFKTCRIHADPSLKWGDVRFV